MASINCAAITDGRCLPRQTRLSREWTMFPTHGESILFALAASTGTGPPTLSGTATERSAYDLQEATSQPGVTASQLVFAALRCRISSQGCGSERKAVRLVAE